MKNNKSDFESIISLIYEARNQTFIKVNEELIMLYFNVGRIISAKVTSGIWGERTVDELANYISSKMQGVGGFNRRGLYRMKQFFETYSIDSECYKLWCDMPASEKQVSFVSPMATQIQKTENEHKIFLSKMISKISWTNHLEILSGSRSAEEKMFYLMVTKKDKLKKLELRRQIKTAQFERTILSNKSISTVNAQFPENLFKDPYIFEFLDLPEEHSETDLEKALVKNLQKFILEIGKGFTYMGNQYRLQVGNKDYYTDLLFYHRDLQCLVMFELKIQEFEPEFMGKLNFYLEALDRDVKRLHENSSIGILLCKGKDTEVVEYAMARNISPALVADYETKLIDKKILTNKLNQLLIQLSNN